MVKIRLAQTGTKNRKTYRVIAIDEHKRRDGRAIEILGFYNPLVKPPEISVSQDRIDYWLSVGAKLTPGVAKILKPSAS